MTRSETPAGSRQRRWLAAMVRDPQLWVPMIALVVGLLVLQWVR